MPPHGRSVPPEVLGSLNELGLRNFLDGWGIYIVTIILLEIEGNVRLSGKRNKKRRARDQREVGGWGGGWLGGAGWGRGCGYGQQAEAQAAPPSMLP